MNENKTYIRNKRKNARIYSWPCKLYVPVTLKIKNRFAEVARMKHLSQAELGAVVVMHYLEHQALMVEAIDAYQEEKKVTESDSLRRET